MTRRTGNQTPSQSIEGELLPADPAPQPKRRRFRLTSAHGIRRELAALYGEFRNGDIDAEAARASAFILRCLLESLRIDEIDQRLKTLEAQADGNQLPRPNFPT